MQISEINKCFFSYFTFYEFELQDFESHVNTSDPVHITCVEKDSKEVNGESFKFVVSIKLINLLLWLM